MIVILDYGLGNLGSVVNMCKRLGVAAGVASEPAALRQADKLILPGVGNFDRGMENLKEKGLLEPLNEAVVGEKKPVLGICLGAQLMTRRSDEGVLPGLGWLDAETVRFDKERFDRPLKVPHMDWTDVTVTKASPLFPEPGPGQRFYFVHSYHLVCRREEDVASTSTYGYRFASSFAKGNIFGVQFHPEKSHRFGMALLRNFFERA